MADDRVLLIPCHEPVEPGQGAHMLGFDDLAGGGRPGVPAFTTRRRLVEVLGPQQPWVAVRAADAGREATAAGVALVLDPVRAGETVREAEPVGEETDRG